MEDKIIIGVRGVKTVAIFELYKPLPERFNVLALGRGWRKIMFENVTRGDILSVVLRNLAERTLRGEWRPLAITLLAGEEIIGGVSYHFTP
ncbi:MAG: hypothetical protein QXH81_09210 [Thermofilaceae archaeon]